MGASVGCLVGFSVVAVASGDVWVDVGETSVVVQEEVIMRIIGTTSFNNCRVFIVIS